jgi:formylglycine-generating enzyme required for sulfatase activity
LLCGLLPVLLLAGAGVLLPTWGQGPAGKKYAVVVGINRYAHKKLTPLKYAENDATALAEVLTRAGYEVVLLTDSAKKASLQPTRANIEARLREVLEKCRGGETVLLALAGHGLQFAGTKDAFFCPRDARPFAGRTDSLLSLNKVYRELDESLASVKLLLVDACRHDPESSRGVDDTAPRPPRGVAALFSCSAGERAFETDKLGGGHGVFFHFVIEGLRGEAKTRKGVVTWNSLVGYVTEQVADEVPRVIRGGARQTPHQMTDLKGKSPVLLALAPRPGKTERESAVPSVVPRTPEKKDTTNTLGMKFVAIRAGKFLRGSDETDGLALDNERPRHEVRLTRAFWLGAHEVTQGDYEAVLDSLPARKPGKHKPMTNLSWYEAIAFCNKLSVREGLEPYYEVRGTEVKPLGGAGYRLPTEAEWEYACRAGGSAKWSFGNLAVNAHFHGWFQGTAKGSLQPVGGLKPNAWGLYDLHGNAKEWCWDSFGPYGKSVLTDPSGPAKGTQRVVRGGSFQDTPAEGRSAARFRATPDTSAADLGFRVARTIVPTR